MRPPRVDRLDVDAQMWTRYTWVLRLKDFTSASHSLCGSEENFTSTISFTAALPASSARVAGEARGGSGLTGWMAASQGPTGVPSPGPHPSSRGLKRGSSRSPPSPGAPAPPLVPGANDTRLDFRAWRNVLELNRSALRADGTWAPLVGAPQAEPPLPVVESIRAARRM